MKNYTIAVAGTGYVGLSIATLLSQNHKVYAVDIVPEKVELINNRKSPIQDEYIEKYLAEKDLDLTATLDAKSAYKKADFVVIAAPTNYDSVTQNFNTAAVEDVIKLVRELLFENKSILPEFSELICVRAVQSNAGETSIYNDWFDALEHMEKEISKYDFDIAIIGAGAYSLPLAAYVKQLGKIAVQMSGSTQILFGIKGKRWEQIPEISKFFNENWIRPSEDETPKGSTKVEGGSYW